MKSHLPTGWPMSSVKLVTVMARCIHEMGQCLKEHANLVRFVTIMRIAARILITMFIGRRLNTNYAA